MDGVAEWSRAASTGRASLDVLATAAFSSLSCGVYQALAWRVSMCFDSPYSPLPLSGLTPRPALIQWSILSIESAATGGAPRAGDTLACDGFAWTLRLVDEQTGASAAASDIRFVNSGRLCGYVAEVSLPPLNGVYRADLRLVHVNGEGSADMSQELANDLRAPVFPSAKEHLRSAGPMFYNVRRRPVPLDGVDPGKGVLPLGAVAVTGAFVPYSSSPNAEQQQQQQKQQQQQRQQPLCVGGKGWWLPARDPLTARHRVGGRLEYVVGGACDGHGGQAQRPHKPRAYASDELEACLSQRKILFLGESTLYETLAFGAATALGVDEGDPGGSVVRRGRMGKYVDLQGVPDPWGWEFPSKAAGADVLEQNPWIRPYTTGSAHGLTVVLDEVFGRRASSSSKVTAPWVAAGTPPPDVIVVGEGLNDAMREPLANWTANLQALADALDAAHWRGKLIFVLAPVRRYKMSWLPGDHSCLGRTEDGLYEYRVPLETWARAGPGGAAGTSPAGIPSVVEPHCVNPGIRRDAYPTIPFFYNTEPRIVAVNRALIDAVSAGTFGDNRIAILDYHRVTAAAPPTASYDGVHFCPISSSLWRPSIDVPRTGLCGPPSVLLHALAQELGCP